MKKVAKYLILSLLATISVAGGVFFIACNVKEDTPHTHSYVENITAPTCTSAGYTTYVCECGENYKDKFVSAKGHTPQAAVKENEVKATCTKEGSYNEVIRCSVCDEVISSTPKTTEKLSHTPKAAVRENEVSATCTKEGSYNEVIRCSVCDEVISSTPKTTEKTQHNYINGVCTECGHNTNLPHTHKYSKEVTAPTCTSAGYTTYVCECGDSYISDQIKANGHTPKEAARENEVKATCTKEGSYNEVIRCSVCNEVISSTAKTTEKLSHTPKEAVRENEIPATCTKAGSYNEVIRCSVCNEVITSTPHTIEKLAHTPKAAVKENEVKATCTKEGSYDEVIRCSVCDEVISSTPKTTEKAQHNYVNGVCTECGYDTNLPHTHQYIKEVTAPTCTGAGYTTYTCECGDSYISDQIKANGHTPKAAVRENEVPATCTKEGSYNEVIRCSVCDEVISSTPHTTEKLSHTPKEAVRENEVPATCTKEGSYNEVVRCSVCNEVISSTPKTIKKLPHTFEQGICIQCGYKIECGLTFNEEGFTLDESTTPATISLSVSNATENIDLNDKITVSTSCTWSMYRDFEGNDELKLKAMSLNVGHNYAYIIVYHPDGQHFSRYKLDIYRLDMKSYTFMNLTNVYASGTIEEKSQLPAPEQNPHRNYYNFAGWVIDNSYNICEFPYTVTSDIVFNALYTPVEYEITYHPNGGTIDTQKMRYNVETELLFDIPVKAGYDFAGWYDNAEFSGEPLTGIEVGNHGDIDLYAKWTPHVYGITYHLNNGTNSAENPASYTIETPDITFAEPTRTGYTFGGWFSDAGLTNSVTTIPLGSYGGVELWAKWIPIVYNITYELNGGTLETAVNDYHIEKSVTFDTPEKTGYDFVGWYDNAEFSGQKVTGIAVGNHGDKTFYAKWTLHEYTITYELDGGKISGPYPKTYNIEQTTKLVNAEKGNYTFMGWYAESDFNTRITEIAKGTYGDLTVYAKWQYGTEGLLFALSSNAYTVTNYYGTATNVIIPETWNNKPVTEIDSSAFSGCSSLTSITIPDSVTGIGSYAFDGCSGLTSLTIGNGVTSIGSYAFYGCSKLTSITIPDSVTSIGSYAFSDCSSLTSITIPDSVTSIGSEAFRNCSSLASITIPDSVTSIGNYALQNCSSLTRVTIPDSVTSIGDSAFYNCSSLASITIPGSVTSIGSEAFRNCSSLASITIPGSVTSIGNHAFYGCSSLTSVTIGNGVTSIGYGAFRGCSGLTSVTIPDSVTSIGSYAFGGCSRLTSITIPDSVTSIGSYAFYYCSSLTSVHITDLAKWCNISFGNCYANPLYYAHNLNLDGKLITDLVIPDSVAKISCGAFRGCSGLASVTIPDSVTSIGNSAFYGCSSLTRVTIPDNVTSIGEGAFSGCTSLESITLPFVGGSAKTASDTYQYPFGYIFGTSSYTGGTATVQYYYGSSTNSTTSNTYYIPSSLKSVTITGGNILYGAFYKCSSLTIITIPNSVTSIGDFAFYNCSSLTSITIPDSVTSIGNYAFSDCSGLTSITIPGSVTSIGSYAFDGCNGLTNVYITDLAIWCNITFGDSDANPLKYAHDLYLNGELVTDLVIPDSVTSIGSCAFYGCSVLASVIIPDSVTSICDYAFGNCSSLTKIYFVGDVNKWVEIEGLSNLMSSSRTLYFNGEEPTAIELTTATKITRSAFRNCSSLTSITIPDSVTSIGSYAFYDCSSLTGVTIGNSVTSIGSYAFYGCSSLTGVTIPDSVTSIGDSAFNGCRSLTSVTIPDSVTSIGDGAFVGCSNLSSITIPDSVTCIGDSAFSSCSRLTSVTIPDSVTSIGDWAFCNCRSLTSITIPNSVTSIGYSAFEDCICLKNVYYKGTAENWNSISIGSSNTELTSATRYYYSETEPELNSDGTAYNGNYWHYVDGKITVWKKDL